MSMEKLAECRRQIDLIDVQILALLNERTGIVHEIGRIKQALALPIYEPKREDQVFDNISQASGDGPLTKEAVRRIYERIIDEMRMVQRVRMVQDGDE